MRAVTFFLLFLTSLFVLSNGQLLPSPYKKSTFVPSSSIVKKVQEIVAQMTLEEKVAQLLHPRDMNDDQVIEKFGKTGLGAFYVMDAQNRNRIQEVMVNKSRLGIPLSFPQEALHGGASNGTIFPMPIAMASSFNLELVERIHQIIALEARAIGADRTLSPNMNLYTDPRFGRIQEGFGEDPYLQRNMAVRSIQALQGHFDEEGYIDHTKNVLAEAKHFAVYGKTEAGQDGSAADISERSMHEIYLRAFHAAVVEANVRSIMPAHNEINGVPCHANEWLLKTMLRDQWGFSGLVASDFGDLAGLQGYGLTDNVEDSAALGLNAGVDQDLSSSAFPALVNASLHGKVPEKNLDDAVSRVLYAKFEAGLFDHPYTDFSQVKDILDAPQHREAAYDLAVQSVVLLKNQNNKLPLPIDKFKKVAVIGPNANNTINQLGGYTNYGAKVVTMLDGIRDALKGKANVAYSNGADIMSDDRKGIPEAVQLAKESDLVVVVVGDSWASCGESYSFVDGDRSSLDLSGSQLPLIESILQTGTQTIVVLVNGRPQTFGPNNHLLEKIEVLLSSWRSGEEGGRAVADIIFGRAVPSGKTPVTWPRNAGQIGGPSHPYYKKLRQYHGQKYSFDDPTPLFPFGFGLSYTTFVYSNLQLSPIRVTKEDTVQVSIDITNTGSFDAFEVAQLYVRDVLSTVVRYNKQLFGFQKVFIKSRQTVSVSFSLKIEELAFFDKQYNWGVEAGEFQVMVGKDSTDENNKGSFFVK